MKLHAHALKPVCTLALCIAGAAWFAVAQAQEAPVADFSAGPPSGRYAFASWTPKGLPELMRGEGASEKVNILGHLFLPAVGAPDKLPAVILVHGSGGIYNAMLDFWPKQFNAAGIAVLSLDSFGPRGVQSTAEDQSQVPFAADTADAFAALKLLASHPRIDPARIAIMGFSRGGINTWRTAVERVIASQKLPGGLRFAAHIPTYSGGCTGLFRLRVKPGVFSRSPMLWIHGDVDDYTPMAPCQDYADRIGKAGTPVEFFRIEGARHKFDMDEQRRINVRGAQRSKEDCPVEMDIDNFAIFDRNTGQRLQGDGLREVLKNCGATGATIEGDRTARDKAAQAALVFLRKVFTR